MIVGFPALTTRWSDFVSSEASFWMRFAHLCSDGCVYVHNPTVNPAVQGRVERYPNTSAVYTFPAVGGIAAASQHFIPTAHGDWIYHGDVGYSSNKMYMRLYAYNPVTGQTKTIQNSSVTLTETVYSVTSSLGYSDVAVDPVTGIGLAILGWSITYTYAVWVGKPSDGYWTYPSASQYAWGLITFTAGAGSTEPVYGESVDSELGATALTGIGLVGAYNNIGLFYNPTDGKYQRIADLASPTLANLRTSVTPLSLITGPNLFRDSDSAATIRDSEGHTWTIAGIGSGLVSINEIEVLGSTTTDWIVSVLVYSGGDASVVYAFCTLAKAGTTFTVLDQVVTGAGSATLMTWSSYLAGKSPFRGASGWGLETVIPLRALTRTGKLLRLSCREVS